MSRPGEAYAQNSGSMILTEAPLVITPPGWRSPWQSAQRSRESKAWPIYLKGEHAAAACGSESVKSPVTAIAKSSVRGEGSGEGSGEGNGEGNGAMRQRHAHFARDTQAAEWH